MRFSINPALVAVLSLSNLALAADIDTIFDRQVQYILETTSTSSSKIQNYLSTLQSNGTWAAVNYASGCTAQRSSWPAGNHWTRILEMTAAYNGVVPEYTNNAQLRSAIRSAMGFWFANDYSTIGNGDCMDREFLPGSNCPCGTPGLWGPNWYSNTIQVPTLSGKACTLLRSSLTQPELRNCTLMASRAYAPFYRNPQPGYVSGANIIDMAVIGISAGLLENNRTGNVSRIADAYGRVHGQVVVQTADRVDGIKPDGSFQQHTGILYDGNYGKDFSNSLLELELQALGTQFQAAKAVQDVFGLHLNGARWMTYTNTLTGIVHWDLSVIGRFISYPVADSRASADLKMDLTQVLTLGQAWNQPDLIDFGSKLTGDGDSTANSGNLNGTRVFWNSDYVVHRTPKTVTTVKLLSSRTTTSECTNSESPFGFHLSDGVTYTYSTGAEYEDIFATLDYNIPPGITTEYGATALQCSTTAQRGIDSYAGGVQAGEIGVAAMRYINPLNSAFGFYKAWFFFPNDVQHLLVSNVRRSATSTAPVYSVLDQRLRTGDVYVDGAVTAQQGNISYSSAKRLWHAGTGYYSESGSPLSLRLETRTGDWRTISLSAQPPSTKNIFAAWISHTNISQPIGYSIFPGTASDTEFNDKAAQLAPKTVVNSNVVSAATDSSALILGAAFWTASGGAVNVPAMGIIAQADRAVVLAIKFEDGGRTKGTVSVADPTHGSGTVNVRITWTSATRHRRWEGCIGHHCPRRSSRRANEVSLSVELPQGGMAGSTVQRGFERGVGLVEVVGVTAGLSRSV